MGFFKILDSSLILMKDRYFSSDRIHLHHLDLGYKNLMEQFSLKLILHFKTIDGWEQHTIEIAIRFGLPILASTSMKWILQAMNFTDTILLIVVLPQVP